MTFWDMVGDAVRRVFVTRETCHVDGEKWFAELVWDDLDGVVLVDVQRKETT